MEQQLGAMCAHFQALTGIAEKDSASGCLSFLKVCISDNMLLQICYSKILSNLCNVNTC